MLGDEIYALHFTVFPHQNRTEPPPSVWAPLNPISLSIFHVHVHIVIISGPKGVANRKKGELCRGYVLGFGVWGSAQFLNCEACMGKIWVFNYEIHYVMSCICWIK